MKITKNYLRQVIKESIKEIKEGYEHFGSSFIHVKELAGKTVTKDPLINIEKTSICIELDNQWYKIDATTDAPTGESYFEGCDAPEVLQKGAKILAAKEFEQGTKETPGDDDIIQIFMLKFKTSKGFCNIEFRAEHNGYYYGNVEIESLKGEPNLSGFKPLAQILK